MTRTEICIICLEEERKSLIERYGNEGYKLESILKFAEELLKILEDNKGRPFKNFYWLYKKKHKTNICPPELRNNNWCKINSKNKREICEECPYRLEHLLMEHKR